MRPEDRTRLFHILDACESVERFVRGRSREDLDQDEMLLFALTRAIEIIGEAAGRLSDEAREAMPSIPWSRVTSMRNRLIHTYFDVDRDILWATVTEDVPTLARDLAWVRNEP